MEDHDGLKLAALSAKEGNFEAVIVELKKVIEANAAHELATGMLAAIYAQLNMTDRAIEYFERTLAINPANALARVQLGLLQLSAGRPRDALATWEPTLGDAKDFIGHFYSGVALLQLQRPRDARALLEKAQAHMPPDHVLYPQLQELLRTTS